MLAESVLTITQTEVAWLRELAKRYMDYATLPVMAERRKQWYDHNDLRPSKPMIIMEMDTFAPDMREPLKCSSPAAVEIEKVLADAIVNYEMIGDDKVMPPYFPVYWKIDIKDYGLNSDKTYATDSEGRQIGFSQSHAIGNIAEDIHKLGASEYSVDRVGTLAFKEFVESVIGDIMPVIIKNNSLDWYLMPSVKAVELMGLENMMFAMMDHPDKVHELFAFITNDMKRIIEWQHNEGLLTANNGYEYAGSGSYGFTDDLRMTDDQISMKQLWGNMNSQETVGISPGMYGDFIYPYYKELSEQFGLLYYGCCEPVQDLWEPYISKLNGLRKVSVSPWADEARMGDYLKERKVIYCRKPSPNYVGVGQFDEKAFSDHIKQTLDVTKGCQLEFSFRDIYTLGGDRSKPGKAVEITRGLIERHWNQ